MSCSDPSDQFGGASSSIWIPRASRGMTALRFSFVRSNSESAMLEFFVLLCTFCLTYTGGRDILYAMRRCFWTFGIVIALFLCPAAGFSFEGPFQVKNQFPLFLYLNAPVVESAVNESSFSLNVSHSSMFMIENSEDWTINLDMEVTELNLKYKRNIPNFFEIGVEVPVLNFSSGFMDGLLNSYHDAFGFPDYGRETRPENEFLYEVKKNGSAVAKAEDGRIGLGDIRLSIKRELIKGDPHVSVKANIEFPTGKASRGFGSGSIDGAIALLVDKRLGDKFNLYVNSGIVFPGDLHAERTVRLKEYFYAGAAVEAALLKNFSLLGQVSFQSSPFPSTGIGPVDRTAALLTFGGRYGTGKDSLEFSLTEDPNTAGAPDVIFNLTYKKKF